MRAGGSLADPVPIGDGAQASTLQIEINGVQRHLLVEHGLDPAVPDNRIIGAALGQALHAPTRMLSNDAALRIKAAHLGLAADEHHPVGRSAATRNAGWLTVDIPQDEAGRRLIDAVYSTGAVDAAAVPGVERLHENEFVVLRCGSQSALARCSGPELVLLGHATPEAWGLRPRSKEQRFALELLLDPDVSVVALDGRAGTGKTLLAIAAGLEQVVERQRVREAGGVPAARARRPRRRRLPARRARREARPVDVGDPRRDRRPHRPAQQQRRTAARRRADQPQPALAGVGDVPARPLPAPSDRRRRRGPEPGADDAEDGADPHRRRHEGDLHRRHQPDRRPVPRRVEQRPGGADPGVRRRSAASAT